MYTRILVPMEDEQQQEPALAHARTLAQHTGATVILAWLVPVVASGERFFTQIQIEPGSSGARRKERGEAYLSQAVEKLQESGVAVESKTVVTPLPPEQAIVELAAEEGIDLIIMATLSQSAVGRFLFGSVGEKVRRRSPVPVLFVTSSLVGEKGA
ncbi:MAG TPA: universal stress protein [Anaerolineae bacterium]|nr:universal stress protein [Anaerolineae bacterium]